MPDSDRRSSDRRASVFWSPRFIPVYFAAAIAVVVLYGLLDLPLGANVLLVIWLIGLGFASIVVNVRHPRARR